MTSGLISGQVCALNLSLLLLSLLSALTLSRYCSAEKVGTSNSLITSHLLNFGEELWFVPGTTSAKEPWTISVIFDSRAVVSNSLYTSMTVSDQNFPWTSPDSSHTVP